LLITLAFFLEGFLGAIVAGFIGALMGVGGGIIIVPVLTIYLGVPIHVAIAASIASVIATSNAGGSGYLEQKITNVKLAFFLEMFTTLGALSGSVLALYMNNQSLFLLFGLMLLYLTYVVFSIRNLDEVKFATGAFIKARQDRVTAFLGLRGSYRDQVEGRDVEYVVNGSLPGSVIGYFAGVGSGLLGIGGGVFKVSAMNRYMNVPMKVAVATSKFMIGVTAAVSAIIYFAAGQLNFYVLAPVAMGTTLGATVGTWYMNRIKARDLKIVFSIILLYMGYTMLARGLVSFGIVLPYLGGS